MLIDMICCSRFVNICCSLPNVIYLDVKAQMSLGYRVLRHLSYNTYARKITGYLYAIEVRLCPVL